jgi:hypothetical protein
MFFIMCISANELQGFDQTVELGMTQDTVGQLKTVTSPVPNMTHTGPSAMLLPSTLSTGCDDFYDYLS